jgi:hypothetical protein
MIIRQTSAKPKSYVNCHPGFDKSDDRGDRRRHIDGFLMGVELSYRRGRESRG